MLSDFFVSWGFASRFGQNVRSVEDLERFPAWRLVRESFDEEGLTGVISNISAVRSQLEPTPAAKPSASATHRIQIDPQAVIYQLQTVLPPSDSSRAIIPEESGNPEQTRLSLGISAAHTFGQIFDSGAIAANEILNPLAWKILEGVAPGTPLSIDGLERYFSKKDVLRRRMPRGKETWNDIRPRLLTRVVDEFSNPAQIATLKDRIIAEYHYILGTYSLSGKFNIANDPNLPQAKADEFRRECLKVLQKLSDSKSIADLLVGPSIAKFHEAVDDLYRFADDNTNFVAHPTEPAKPSAP